MNAPLPKPLPIQTFHILLALTREPLHGYAIKTTIISHSLGALIIPDGSLYPLLRRLTQADFIANIGPQSTDRNDQPRDHYRLTPKGRYHLKCEFKRWRHVVHIGEATGYFNNKLSPDLQRLLEELT